MPFNREVYFASVKASLFGGSLSQGQVNGQNYILAAAEALVLKQLEWVTQDIRHLSYCLATTYHETAKTMLPIEEYGKGQGMAYGKKDPETGQVYFGRGFVQLTWRDNYRKATLRLGLAKTPDDLEWHADRALDPTIAADVMFQGMTEGWFRPPNTLGRFFDEDTEDAYGARDIINGDKRKVPTWSHGVSIGNLIADYHGKFLTALKASHEPWPTPEPVPPVPAERGVVRIESTGPVDVWFNGVKLV